MNGITSTDLGTMLTNMQPLFTALQLLVRTIAGLVGFWLFVSAIRIAIKATSGQHPEPSRATNQVFIYIVLSAFLFNYSATMPGLWNSIAGSGGNSGIYAYTNISAPGPYAQVVTAGLEFVELMGWIYGYKGVMDWKNASDGNTQPGLVSKGFVHVFGGLACIHVGSFLQMVMAQLVGQSSS